MDINSPMSLGEALAEASLFLLDHQHEEASAQQYWLRLFDRDLNDLVAQIRQPMSQEDYLYFKDSLDKVVKHQPLEYITGQAYFREEAYKVTPDTLIPRPESEGLVQLVDKYYLSHSPKKLLDLGTGSGILAISIKKLFSNIQVYASDVSAKAIEVAKENAQAHQVEVEFSVSDMFGDLPLLNFDMIVSNPPYISYGEILLMDQSVLENEPHQALFAEDNGLGFYRRMASEVKPYIGSQGLIFLEIGFKQGPAVKEIFQKQFPQASIYIEQDFNHHDRYIIVELKG